MADLPERGPEDPLFPSFIGFLLGLAPGAYMSFILPVEELLCERDPAPLCGLRDVLPSFLAVFVACGLLGGLMVAAIVHIWWTIIHRRRAQQSRLTKG